MFRIRYRAIVYSRISFNAEITYVLRALCRGTSREGILLIEGIGRFEATSSFQGSCFLQLCTSKSCVLSLDNIRQLLGCRNNRAGLDLYQLSHKSIQSFHHPPGVPKPTWGKHLHRTLGDPERHGHANSSPRRHQDPSHTSPSGDIASPRGPGQHQQALHR
jgi:hypothetical protein